MNNKIILTGDLHAKTGLNLQICLDYFDYLEQYSIDNDINKIAILGDLIDKATKIDINMFVPLFKKIEYLKDKGFEMWFILGNHDIVSTITNQSLLETFSKFGHLVGSPDTFEIGNSTINMVPFTKDESMVLTVNADFLFTHLNIIGFDLGGGRIAGEEQQAFPVSMFSNYERVFTGHYHKRQIMGNIEYVGSPYQLNFGDSGDFNKGFTILDCDTKTFDFVKYNLAPKFVKYTYDDIWNKLKTGEITKETLKNDLVKIVVNKKVDELSKLKSLLYNEYGVVDITNEFEAPENLELNNSAKIEVNKSVADMIQEFISSIKVSKDGFEISGSDLVEKFLEIKGESK